MNRPLSPMLAAALTAMSVVAMSAQALAAGFGTGSIATVLGQPLDFVVQVRTEAGETIPPECVSAEVLVGERRLSSALVRVAIEPVNAELLRVRVTSAQVVDEPVVNVGLSLGCPPRLSRRFVVLAELPGSPAAAAAPSQATSPALVLPGAQDAPAQTAAPAASAAAASMPNTDSPSAPDGSANGRPAGTGTGAGAGTGTSTSPGVGSPRPGTGDRVVLRARPPGAVASGAAAQRPRAEARPRPTANAQAQPRRQPVARVQPRLRLEAAEPPPKPVQPEMIAQALAAVEQAASAARAAAAAASAASVRITALERTVEQLRNEARAGQEQAVQLRQRLSSSEEASRWMLPLAAAVLVLGALAGWLGWRLTALQRERRADWRAPAPAPAPAASPETTQLASPTTSFVTVPAVGNAPAGARWHRGTPAWPPPAVTPVDPWVSSDMAPTEGALGTEGTAAMDVLKTQPLQPLGLDEGSPRDVTIEELIDLEQQAEFFVVLGQDDAAIDLLVEHLRSTGGGSPLPYLKLLEIYRRRGDREAYERTRTRFNHRFNAYAPEWGADLAAGRSLDDYAGVVPRLQQVWPRPLDAMAELEALLFRKSRGELFDLPAYREVLLLYSLARDLLDRKAADASNVDFLIPMSEATEFGATAPVPYLGLESDTASLRDEAERPTSPLDFDVTVSSKRPSLFGDLDPPSSGTRGPGSRRP